MFQMIMVDYKSEFILCWNANAEILLGQKSFCAKNPYSPYGLTQYCLLEY